MRAILAACLDAATAAGASYADARVEDTSVQRIATRNGVVEAMGSSASLGFGVRVVTDGSWGFASSSEMTAEAAARTALLAVGIARASATVAGRPVRLAPLEPVRANWSGPCAIDPFSVPSEDKIALLLEADATLRAEPRVKLAEGQLRFQRCRKTFASSEGALIEQDWTESCAGIVAYAIDGGLVCERSYPNSHGGGCWQGGWETVLSADLVGNAPRVAEQAAALLTAPECPSGPTTLVIGGDMLALQVHESVGHPTELDRVLGDEAAFAGTSWVGLGDLGTLRYGSEHVSVTSDATIPGSLGSFGYDDEGVPACRDDIIRNGVLVGFQSSRESAAEIGRASNGCMRADGFARIPLVRMTTVSLEPGSAGTLEDLLSDTGEGLYVETNHSWSIDDKRLNFQFACEIGWEISGGRLGRMVRSPNYTGITPRFWNSCDAVCGPSEWTVWGLDNCGKGEPMQVAHVAHGAAPARFRDVETGVGR